MGDVEKPSGTAATEVMGEAWPPESESAYFAKAKQCLAMAAKEQKNAQTNTHAATYTDQEADGRAYNAIAEELHIRAHASTVSAEKWAALSGWAQHMGELIQSTKQKIVAEVKAHEGNCISGKSITSTADVMKESGDVATHKGNVATAMTALETGLTAAETSCASDVIPAPPGGTPKIPDQDASPDTSDIPATANPSGAPSGGVVGGAGNGTPSSSATPGAGAPGGGAPAQPLPPSAFAAPPAAATPPAAASPAAMGSPTGASPAGAESPGGGMPMSGMPMSGMPQMPQMQPPQMPSGGQTPGADVAKTVGDTVSKLAGKDGGTPVSAETLDKLLGAQGGDHDGKASSDPAKLPDSADDPLKKVFGNQPGSPSSATAQAHALDPYSAANQNPSLNSPQTPTPPHLQSPSPAAPVVTAAPTGTASAPMTELSADENYPGPQQHSTPAPSPSDAVTTHPSAGPAAPPASPPAPGAPVGAPQPAQSLGAYNPGALGAPAPMAPMGPMGAPMGGMMTPPAAGGGGGGSAAPVLAAAVPAAVVEAATSGRRRAPEATRVTALPPEHATAERHLAGLLRVFTQKGWATAILAIACLEGQAGVRYLLATADGVSLVPLGVPLPAGVELLSAQPLSASFTADWSGHVHPARKLAAWAAEHPEAGRLVYLVSNDGSGVPAVGGSVVEVRQTAAERAGMAGGSPATLARTAVATSMIPAEKAADALGAFGSAWGITDATTEDWRTAPGRLWASRWDRDRPDDYPAILATYLYIEGLEALRQGREADSAYSASALAAVRPHDWVAA